MKRIRFLLVILMLALAACGGDNDDNSSGGLESASGNKTPTQEIVDVPDSADVSDTTSANTSLIANIPPVEANIFEMPTIDGLDGRLLFVQGNASSVSPSDGDSGRLFLANFDGNQPQMIASRVYTTSVSLAPDGKHVFYIAIEGRSWYSYLLNLETLESTQLSKLQSQYGGTSGWSPDGQWLTYANPPPVGPGQILVSTDGASRLELGNGAVFWTEQNQIIFINIQFDFNGVGTGTAVDLQLIDPTTQEQTVLDLGLDLANPSLTVGTEFIEVLQAEGHTLVSNYWTSAPNGGSMILPDDAGFLNVQGLTPSNATTNSPALCGQFQINELTADNTEGTLLYEVEDTLTFSDIQQYDEGYLLERWYLNGCDFGLDNLRVDLEYIKADADPQVIVAGLYTGTDLNPSFVRVNNGAKYTVSPDGHYLIWIEGSLNTLTTTLKITDLTTQETADLMAWTASSSNNFVIFDAFSSVFWVE